MITSVPVIEPQSFIGSDYSGQEPRLLAFYSRDKKMAETYKAGKDVYAVIAQIIYNNNYEDNLEFKDGVLYPEGKERRATAKPILLGRPAKGLKSTIKLHYAPSWSNPCRITL